MATTLPQNQGLCCLEIAPDGIAFVCASNPDKPEIEICEFHSYPQYSDEQLRWFLTDIIAQNELKKRKCSWMLHPSQYRLTLVDTPNVPKTEYKDAVRWQIKDIINYPLEEVVVDVFYADELDKKPKKIYAVSAQNSFLQNAVNIIQESGLQPTAIDVREFAIRNLLTNTAETNEPVGFFDITEEGCLLVIMLNNRIQFVRHIPVGLKKSRSSDFVELTTELQRSFDYCAQELGYKIPAKFFIAPSKLIDANMTQSIAQKLETNVLMLDLQNTVTFNVAADLETQKNCWAAIGGALRT